MQVLAINAKFEVILRSSEVLLSEKPEDRKQMNENHEQIRGSSPSLATGAERGLHTDIKSVLDDYSTGRMPGMLQRSVDTTLNAIILSIYFLGPC